MTAPIVFLDTETTGLDLTDDIWEFAGIRRDPDGTEQTLHLFIEHDTKKCDRLPESFRVDHDLRFDEDCALSRPEAASLIMEFLTDGGPKPHLVGAVPNFDTERLALLLAEFGYKPAWHYHLIDVEALAVGWLRGKYGLIGGQVQAPWKSDDLSRTCGVEPPSDEERHTALGDARWAMRLYDAIMGTIAWEQPA